MCTTIYDSTSAQVLFGCSLFKSFQCLLIGCCSLPTSFQSAARFSSPAGHILALRSLLSLNSSIPRTIKVLHWFQYSIAWVTTRGPQPPVFTLNPLLPYTLIQELRRIQCCHGPFWTPQKKTFLRTSNKLQKVSVRPDSPDSVPSVAAPW